jgi:hypothetical protein
MRSVRESSDDNTEDRLTREDLLALTGSAESGTSMEDTVHSASAGR